MVPAESILGHIKGKRSFRRFSLRSLEKVQVEFGIVALAHNLLQVAGIRLATYLKNGYIEKDVLKTYIFSTSFILGAYRRAQSSLGIYWITSCFIPET